jgi:DNA-binding response OmpR family regulator
VKEGPIMEETLSDKHYKVLVCDDDNEYRASQLRMLNLFNWSNRHISFKAFEAASGEEAMKVLEAKKIDCVLLDYDMPDLDGIETMRKILEEHPEMSIVMVTGAGCEMTAVEAMKVGAMDYLRKDDNSIELLERTIVNSVIKSRMQHKIEDQAKALMGAERHRVMLQSLTTACHHLAQPITVLRTYMVLLKRKTESEETQKMLVEAYKAIELVAGVLWKLNHIDEYQTETYLEAEKDSGRKEVRMLKMRE